MMRKFRLLAIVVGSAAALVTMSAREAGAIDLTYDDTLKDIQQTDNSPCVIGSPSCDNTLEYTTVGGGPGNKDETSPTYTVDELIGAVGSSTMNLLVDVNQACGDATKCPITIDTLEVYIGGTLVYEEENTPLVIPIAGSLSGNGYSDGGWRTLDLSGYDGDEEVYFHIVWSNQSDGQESFFLASTTALPCGEGEGTNGIPCPVVPEPASLLLLGSGLAGLATTVRKRMAKRS